MINWSRNIRQWFLCEEFIFLFLLLFSSVLSRQARRVEGVAAIGFGEEVFEDQGAAGLDGGEAVFLADAVDSFI